MAVGVARQRRQRRIAEVHGDVVDADPEDLARDLGQRRRLAATDVGHAAAER